MKLFMRLKEVMKHFHIDDQIAVFLIFCALCYLSFLLGMGWEKDQQLSNISTELSGSTCKSPPGLQNLENMLEKVQGEK